MLNSLLQSKKWQEKLVEETIPENDWDILPIFVRNGKRLKGATYNATMWYPPTWLMDADTGFFVNPLLKRTLKTPNGCNPRWISISTAEMGEESSVLAYVKQISPVKWVIVGGENPGLIGARITHLLPDSDYEFIVDDGMSELIGEQ